MGLKLDDYKDFEMFYKLPQELFDDCFKGLSLGAKVLYAILRDKWGQSQKNGWHDENGIYCNFSVKLLADLMGCSEKTVTSYKKELNNYCLISERRQFNSTNKIYVNRVSEAKRNVHEKITCRERKNLPNVHEKITCRERKNLPTNQTNINQTNLDRTFEPEGVGANTLYSIEDAPAENDLGIVHDKGLTTVELVENRQKPTRSNSKSNGRLKLSDDGFDPRLGF